MALVPDAWSRLTVVGHGYWICRASSPSSLGHTSMVETHLILHFIENMCVFWNIYLDMRHFILKRATHKNRPVPISTRYLRTWSPSLLRWVLVMVPLPNDVCGVSKWFRTDWMIASHKMPQHEPMLVNPHVWSLNVETLAGAQWPMSLQLLEDLQRNAAQPDVVCCTAAINACEKGAAEGVNGRSVPLFKNMNLEINLVDIFMETFLTVIHVHVSILFQISRLIIFLQLWQKYCSHVPGYFH